MRPSIRPPRRCGACYMNTSPSTTFFVASTNALASLNVSARVDRLAKLGGYQPGALPRHPAAPRPVSAPKAISTSAGELVTTRPGERPRL